MDLNEKALLDGQLVNGEIPTDEYQLAIQHLVTSQLVAPTRLGRNGSCPEHVLRLLIGDRQSGGLLEEFLTLHKKWTLN